jgi:3-phosphoshikimate 1-carboxyvinyltransferase
VSAESAQARGGQGLPDPLPIEPLRGPFDAVITPPGSKSLTCRAYVLAALARGESRIQQPLRSDDTDNLLKALGALGADWRWTDHDVTIQGVAGRFPRGGEVNLGDGGTPTRFMIAAACLAREPVVVDGSRAMRRRPIAQLVELLGQLGAQIEYVNEQERLPVRVTPSDRLRGGELEIPVTASSQFISAMLLIGAFLPDGLHLRFVGEPTSASYVDLTVQALRDFSIDVEPRDTLGGIQVPAAPPGGCTYRIEPDASSAVYWMVAAALIPGARIRIAGLPPDSAQPDCRILRLLHSIGVERQETTRAGQIVVRGPDRLGALDCDARLMPDAALAMAVLAARAQEPSRITGLGTLAVKETDRITALARELERLGCTVQASDDALAIDPAPSHDRPVVIETYQDHRMAMAFAVLGLVRRGISIQNPDCVSKSYPGFWTDLYRLQEESGGVMTG